MIENQKEIFHNCQCYRYVMEEIEKRIKDNSDLFNVGIDTTDENIAREVAKRQYATMELVNMKEDI